MSFFRQVYAGTVQELQIYSNFPKRLIAFAVPVIYPIFYFIYSRVVTEDIFYSSQIHAMILVFLELVSMFPPLWVSISEMTRRRQAKIDRFIQINGMSKAAYVTKTLLAHNLLMFISTSFKITGVFLLLLIITKNIEEYFYYSIAANIAAVNFSLLISRFSTPRGVTVTIMCLLVVIPLSFQYIFFLNRKLFDSSIFGIISFFNPYLLQIYSITKDTQSEWNEASLIALAFSIAYFCLYLFLEKYAEYKTSFSTHKKKEYEDLPVELSLALMDGHSDPLLDIENPDVSLPRVFEEQAPESDKKAILRVSNLTKIFKDSESPALNNISLQIFENEIVCLIGHNGAGKTTFVKILSGLVSQTEGSIYYENEPINIAKIGQSIGLCTQDNLALTENTVFENLIFMAKIKNVDRSRLHSEVQRVMQKLGIVHCKDILVCDLNQEQRKKLSIAIALLNNTQIILIDEPTSGLDAVARREFWKIIRALKQDQKTVIFTTQFLDDAEELADRITILSKGKVFAVGSVEYVKKKFGTGYTLVISNSRYPAYLATQAPHIDKIIRSLIPSAEIISDTTLNILKYAISSREQKKFSRLFRELEAISDIQINLQRTSLEEAFESLERNPDFDCLPGGQPSSLEQEEGGENHQIQETFWTKNFQTSFGSQFKMIVLERILKAKVNKKQIIQSFIFPSVMIFVAIMKFFDKGPHPMWFHYFQVHLVWTTVDEIIHDREKYNNMLKTKGLSPLAYWLGNFFIDCLLLIPTSLSILLLKYLDGSLNNILDSIVAQASLIMGIVVMCYNCSRWFQSSPLFIVVTMLLLFFSLCLLIPVNDFKSFDSSVVFGYTVLFSIPHICLFPAALNMIGSFPPFIPIFCHFVFIVYKDSQYVTPKNGKITNKIPPSFARPVENPFAYQEKMRLLDPKNQDAVKIIEGHRIYPDGWRALWDLNFGVEKGQIFCLLGPNGAGKTTTFDLITRQSKITFGKVCIDGQEVRKDYNPKYNTGFCLQSDVLWDDLTVEEHFRLYSCLKGLNEKETKETMKYLTKVLGMKIYIEKKVKNLSAGTKRKLSVALALIGGPEIIVLDEPTTGVDAIGRSQIWKLLKTFAEKKKSTVLISTHYMEDAELVADKLGILVNGSLMNLGSIADIRRTYQEHYLTVDGISEGFAESLKTTIHKIIPEAIEDPTSSDDKKMIFRVPSMAMKFSTVCLELESLSTDKKIADFSINVKTLEQAFLGYANQQVEKPKI